VVEVAGVAVVLEVDKFDMSLNRRTIRIAASVGITLLIAVGIALAINSISATQNKNEIFYAKLIGLVIGWMSVTIGIFFIVSTDLRADARDEVSDRTRVYSVMYIGLGASMLLITSRFVVRSYPDWIAYEVLGYFGYAIVLLGFFIRVLSTWEGVDTPVNDQSELSEDHR